MTPLWQEYCKKFKALANDVNCDFFLYESPSNHYSPAPPDGYFALRSSKRRIFLPNMYRGKLFNISELTKLGIAIESSLN